MRQKVALAYLGTVSGFLVLLLLNSSVWLEMRIDTPHVLPLFTLAGFMISSGRRRRISFRTAVSLQLSVLLLFFVKYGFDVEMLSIMPAMLLREGFYLDSFDLQTANIALVTMIGLGNIAVIPLISLKPSATRG